MSETDSALVWALDILLRLEDSLRQTIFEANTEAEALAHEGEASEKRGFVNGVAFALREFGALTSAFGDELEYSIYARRFRRARGELPQQ